MTRVSSVELRHNSPEQIEELRRARLLAQRIYRVKNREMVLATQRAYRAKNREKFRSRNKAWIEANRDRYNASKARYRLKLKIEVMSLYANPVACMKCGFSQIDGLVLDHINDDGAEHRRKANISCRGNSSGTTLYEVIRRDGKMDGLQVLCANCNTIKQIRRMRSTSIKDPQILAEVEGLYARPIAR